MWEKIFRKLHKSKIVTNEMQNYKYEHFNTNSVLNNTQNSSEINALGDLLKNSEIVILIVDDDMFLQEIMTAFLERHSFVVERADNGKIGYEKYIENPNKFSIIFVDMEMPIMNGSDMTREIRRSGLPTSNTIPIIATTGNSINNSYGDNLFTSILRKPFEMEKILRVIHSVLH